MSGLTSVVARVFRLSPNSITVFSFFHLCKSASTSCAQHELHQTTHRLQSWLVKNDKVLLKEKKKVSHCEKTQLVLVESCCLLSRASSRRSLALRLLYSQYSSAMGPRSSFWQALSKYMEERRCEQKAFIFFVVSEMKRTRSSFHTLLPYADSFVQSVS